MMRLWVYLSTRRGTIARWYHDAWLFVVTILVLLGFMAQSADRKSAINNNVQARYSDCIEGESTRKALREQVEQGRSERPVLLKLVPQFDKPEVLAIIKKNEEEELKGFAPRNCLEYAEEALPGHHKRYTLKILE